MKLLLAAITTTTGAQPTVVGKPAGPLFEAAAEATGATRPLVVGDRLETDVGGAEEMGWDSLLVLSGAARPADLLASRALPTYVGEDLSAVLDDRPPGRFRRATEREVEPVRALLDAAREWPTTPGPTNEIVAQSARNVAATASAIRAAPQGAGTPSTRVPAESSTDDCQIPVRSRQRTTRAARWWAPPPSGAAAAASTRRRARGARRLRR